MICHIVQNGGYMSLLLCFWISLTNSTILQNTYTIQEFCSGNLYIHNIEPGEPYKLILKSDVSTSGITKWHKSKRKCWQEFKTSDSSAHFVVYISNMSIPSCQNCRCSYFEISVPECRKRYCGNSTEEASAQNVFYSKSDKLSIGFFPDSTSKFDVTLMFSVQRNVYIITGTSFKDNSDSSNFIETPYFPTPYPPNYRAEYILQSEDDGGHVLLVFLDFQISHQSFIEVIGNNGTHPTRFYGNVFRPPAIVSQSARLSIKFISNDDKAGMPGFRAVSSFIKNIDPLIIPYTDCSGSQNGRGGYMNIKTYQQFGLYDCVWHIMPLSPFTKSNRSVTTNLQNVGYKSRLEFRSGHHSKSKIVRVINCEVEICDDLNIETIIPASENLYIRFNGYLDKNSIVNISYSTFHSGDCSNKEFKCNDRCLLIDFRCDGIKQCPNGTDEDLCPSANVSEIQVPFHPSIQPESSDDIFKKFIFFITLGVVGLLAFCILICVLIPKFRRRNVTTEQLLPQQSAAEMSAVPPTLYPVSVNDNNLPSYKDYMNAKDCYPPLLYTRAKQRVIPNNSCTQGTTSFCACARMTHSADSCNVSSDTDNIFLNVNDDLSHPCSNSNTYNVEIIQSNLAFKKSQNAKRSHSLDSKLNELVNHDSCHFLLSIVHPVSVHQSNDYSVHRPVVHCQTLPPNFKISAFKNSDSNRPKMNNPHWLPDSNVDLPEDRRFTWSFVPRGSIRSEILTVVKTRCFSDPCNGISVHCSLY